MNLLLYIEKSNMWAILFKKSQICEQFIVKKKPNMWAISKKRKEKESQICVDRLNCVELKQKAYFGCETTLDHMISYWLKSIICYIIVMELLFLEDTFFK